MKNIVAYFLIAVSSLVILLGLTELTLRLFIKAPSYPAIPIEFSELTGHYADGVWINNNFSSDFLNFRNGTRVIPDVPIVFDSRIYVFGNSTIESLFVDDSHTSTAFLQRLLNSKSYHVKVENWADSGAFLSTEFARLQYAKPKAGSVVVFVDGSEEEEQSLNCLNSYQGTYFMTYYVLCGDLNYLPHLKDEGIANRFKQRLQQVETYCQQHQLIFIHIFQPRPKLQSFYNYFRDKPALFPSVDFMDDKHFSLRGEQDFSDILYERITQSLEF